MNFQKISSKIASWSLILVGIGHTITYLTNPKTELQNNFILKMKAFPVDILGSKSNLFFFHHGFSLMMGVLLFGYGLLNLFLLKNNKATTTPTNIIILNSIICLTALLLSIKYFFIVPIVFTSVAFFGYTVSLILKLKK
ncbi:hypothetical protein PG911_14585 [Tenacibaculum ovolyticum]|uniref:LIC_13387 family protein n=1 Tax=Tenacibaculum ovolyticum TaxID=104270 RepID=UPI0022F3F540|nr:hypothetical protein [Tenacibaculum ovolyticum]WBX75863.1 hypothetical protein PG911_14585 [Tenacibaculum ovolyticum]